MPPHRLIEAEPPLVLFEDDDLLVVHKPAGINTHKPDEFAPDGLHEWLKTRLARWSGLSILHRLDKETSGVMVFGKSDRANRSLTQQFAGKKVRKEYLLLSNIRPTRTKCFTHSQGAETEFERLDEHGGQWLILARPFTGKTHQIRRQALESGFPILGDTQYEGAPAARLMLHAHRLQFEHPGTGQAVAFEASVPGAFEDNDPLTAALEMRALLFGPDTNCYRLVNETGDGFDDLTVDRYDQQLHVRCGAAGLDAPIRERLVRECSATAVWEQLSTRQEQGEPVCTFGSAERERFPVRENGVTYLIRFGEGLSTGIFLDQRENRRRLLQSDLAGKTVLNTFAYTCAFSVAAALAGAVTTSVDLSRNYLDWGRENFRANGLDDSQHDFIFGDVFDWLRRFQKKERRWDLVILDPPTFSTTKAGRSFQAGRNYGDLAALAVPLVAPGGTLFCSTNQRTLHADEFVTAVQQAIRASGRKFGATEFQTLPADYRVAQGQRPYLKTVWIALD